MFWFVYTRMCAFESQLTHRRASAHGSTRGGLPCSKNRSTSLLRPPTGGCYVHGEQDLFSARFVKAVLGYAPRVDRNRLIRIESLCTRAKSAALVALTRSNVLLRPARQ